MSYFVFLGRSYKNHALNRVGMLAKSQKPIDFGGKGRKFEASFERPEVKSKNVSFGLFQEGKNCFIGNN